MVETPRGLDGQNPLLSLEKNSLRSLWDQLVLYTAYDDVGLHHGIIKAKLLLSVTASPVQNVSAFVGRKPS
jgi:hypothetical protein